MRSLFLLACLGLLVACGGGENADDARKAELQREVESLRAEKAAKQARVEALKQQLESEAAAKAEALREIERIRPATERVEEAEARVLEIEEQRTP